MGSLVELKYNPYIPKLNILLDGRPPSEYSRLTQYSNEDIWLWCNDILNDIYSEINDEFFISFVGRKEDSEIMKLICESYNRCNGFAYSPCIIDDSPQNRLGRLNKLLENRHILNYSKTRIHADFLISNTLISYRNDIATIDIKNRFCSVDVDFVNREINDNHYLFFLTDDVEKCLKNISVDNLNRPIFIICFGEKNKLKRINGYTYVYETTKEKLIDTIFDCMLTFPLIIALRNCVNSIKNRYNDIDLKRVYMMDTIIDFDVERRLEIGTSNELKLFFSPQKDESKVQFKIQNEKIATTNGLCIFGHSLGTTILEAYMHGEKTPFKSVEIEVIKRNRIQKIILDDDRLVMGVGDVKKINYDFFPPDADNSNTIKWKTTDNTVAIIDSNGRLKCVGTGICNLHCIAENISAKCECVVKPYLEEIIIDVELNEKGILSIEPMQEMQLPIKTMPIDCVDNTITMVSSNYDVVNIIGNKIIGKNLGKAEITISNNNSRKTYILPIVVEKKKNNLLKSLFNKK